MAPVHGDSGTITGGNASLPFRQRIFVSVFEADTAALAMNRSSQDLLSRKPLDFSPVHPHPGQILTAAIR
jgi:hypothetical protein